MMIVILVIVILLIAVPGILLFRKKLNMSWTASILIPGLVVLVAIPALFFVVLAPKQVILVDESGAAKYFVMGSNVKYDLADGSSAEVELPKLGYTVINNTDDTLVVEEVKYYTVQPSDDDDFESLDDLDILVMLKPYSVNPMHGFYPDYVFETPPDEIETESSASKISKSYLRRMNALDPYINRLYVGDMEDGEPAGEGKLYYADSLLFAGSFANGNPVK